MRLVTLSLATVLGLVACKQAEPAAAPQPEVATPQAAPAVPAAPAQQAQAAVPAVPTPAAPMAETAAAAPAAESQVYNVTCACSLGLPCGSMIEVNGAWVPLAGKLDLGPHAFCGKQGLKAEAQGELKAGKFVASAFKLIEPDNK